ncbi:MAG: NAD(P)-dependent oxidoreductase [Phycisphaerales bacterium]
MTELAGPPRVIVTEPIPADPIAWLGERADVAEIPCDHPEFRGSLADAAGLVVRTHTRVDAALLDAAPRLRVVGRAGVGVDNIDLNACQRRGVAVVNTPEANTDAVVSYVWSWVLSTVRPVVRVAPPVADWAGVRAQSVVPREIPGLTLGVYGVGRIGSRVARVGVALGMRVLCHDLLEVEAINGAEPVSRETLLASADVLSLHVDGRRSNRGLIDAEALEHVKPDVTIVNTARGMIIDPTALAAFLASHRDARALLDVHDPEPIPADHPLVGLPNAELSPHVAAATAGAKERMGWVVADVWRVLEGHEPAFRVV